MSRTVNDLLKEGGEWLGVAHKWLRRLGYDRIIFGSAEEVCFMEYQLEELAAEVALTCMTSQEKEKMTSQEKEKAMSSTRFLVTYWRPSGGQEGNAREVLLFDTEHEALDEVAAALMNGASSVQLYREIKFKFSARIIDTCEVNK